MFPSSEASKTGWVESCLKSENKVSPSVGFNHFFLSSKVLDLGDESLDDRFSLKIENYSLNSKHSKQTIEFNAK